MRMKKDRKNDHKEPEKRVSATTVLCCDGFHSAANYLLVENQTFLRKPAPQGVLRELCK
jgi:hypothetical protein